MDERSAGRLGAVLAATWLVVLAVVDVSMPPDVIPDDLFALAPLIACATLGARPTAVFGAAAVLLTVLSGVANGVWDTPQQYIRLLDVVLVSAAAVVIAWVRVRRLQHLARVTDIAETAQRAILPRLPTTLSGVGAAARYLSSARDASVGGDLYDCCLAGGRTRFVVGDVRGKGVAAVEHAARVIRSFRQSAPIEDDLAMVAADMDEYLAPFFDDEDFATALLVDLTRPEVVTLSSCGHPPALLARRDGTRELVELPPGLPLGLGGSFTQTTVPWNPGDRLLLYTDGLSEARDERGEFLPVLDLAPLLLDGPLDTALDAVLQRVQEHLSGEVLGDDLAVLVLERTGPVAEKAGGPDRAVRAS